MSALPVSQNKRRTLYRNMVIVFIALLTVLAIVGRVFDVQLHGLASALLIGGLVLAVVQFQALDEVAKQAHYVAWYWGSLAVLGVIAMINIASFAFNDARAADWLAGSLLRLWGETAPNEAFMAGLMTGPVLMVVGFSVWWAVFWLRRR